MHINLEFRKNGIIYPGKYKWQIFSSSGLKLIAIITMLIDHIGASLLEGVLMNYSKMSMLIAVSPFWSKTFLADYEILVNVDNVFRAIGRLAFPIFAFMIVEGYLYTKNVWKYFARLMIFAFVSEVPFDMAFFDSFFFMEYQNVYFTLALGLLAIILWDLIRKKFANPVTGKANAWGWILSVLTVLGIMVFSDMILVCDYGSTGIFAIFMMYILSKWYLAECIGCAGAFFWEITAPIAVIPILMYNGKRGLNIKYFFYAFYPAHLLILGIVRILLIG